MMILLILLCLNESYKIPMPDEETCMKTAQFLNLDLMRLQNNTVWVTCVMPDAVENPPNLYWCY